jgi:N-acetylglucosamine-6-phosphate deacetylase
VTGTQRGAAAVELPGLFDLQVNGFAGVDFNDPATTEEDLARAAAAMRATGVTRFLPTLITGPSERFLRCARQLAGCRDPAVAGIHMEGPYLAPEASGAHPSEHLTLPSADDFARRQEAAGGRIVLVTLAPELPGALALIERLVEEGVRVAIGHSAAPAGAIRDAVRAGATLSTHLGNACPLTLPRHPNLLWEQLAADELAAGLIVDGHHLPASVVKVMVRAKSLARTLLVTDATAAAAQPPGRYRLSEIPVVLSPAGRVTIEGTDRLAGSALTLDVAVANTVRFTGHSLAEVWPLASTQPAAAMGMPVAGRVLATHDPETGALTVHKVLL